MQDRSTRIMTGLFPDREAAERGYDCIRARGYGDRDVSVLMSDDTRTRCFPKDETAKTQLGIGALLAGLAAAGFAIPGLPIIAIGPLAAAIAGGGTGGALGALVGGLVGYGIPEDRAKLYQTGIDEGGIVMGFTPRTDEDADYIEREWTSAGSRQVYRPGVIESGGRL
jgi:hypothetical protein